MPELIPAEPGTPEWLAARRQGVTATDIVTILGLSSHDSVYSLFWRKMGQIPDEPDRDRWQLGKALEPYIKELWSEAADDTPFKSGLYRSSARPWQMATPDSLLKDEGLRIAGVLECKSWADADRHSWDQGPPAQVRAQVLWQMDVMGVSIGHVGVVFLPSGRFESYTIEHDTLCGQQTPRPDGLCSICCDLALMRAAGEEFMGRLRLELPPPDPDSSAATLAAVRARFARVPAKQAEIDQHLWTRFALECALVKQHEEARRELEILVREQMGEAAELCVNGELVARRVVSDAQVKAHVRHQDYIRRIKQGDDSADQ